MTEFLLDVATDILARTMADAARGRDFRRIVYDDRMLRPVGQPRDKIRASAEELLHPGVGYIVVIYDGRTPEGAAAAICDAWNCLTGESLALAQPYRKTLLGAWKPQGGVVRLKDAPEPLIILPTPAEIGLKAKDRDDESGAELTAVAAGSPAEQAGLEVGDIVSLLGEQRISSLGDLVWAAKQLKGETAAIVVYTRDGERRTSTVTFGKAL